MAVYTTVASGVVTSTGVTLERLRGPFTIATASWAGTTVRVKFATLDSTVAVSGDYLTLYKSDGSGDIFTALSGSAPGISAVIAAPTPYLQILVGSQGSGVRSFTILPA